MKLLPVELLLLQLRENGFPEPLREHRFHPSRKWRFDLAWPANHIPALPLRYCNVAIECDGGQFAFRGGRHNSDGDLEKINAAQSIGWKVYRFSNKMIEKGQAIKFMKELK